MGSSGNTERLTTACPAWGLLGLLLPCFVKIEENLPTPLFSSWPISMDSSGRKARVGFAFSSRILNVGGSQMGEWETSFHKKKVRNLETIISQKKQKRVAECLLIQWSWCKALPGWLFVPTCHQWLSSGHYTRGGGGVYGTRIQDMDSTNNHLHNQLLCSCSSFDDINVICELSYQEYSVSQNRL